MTARVFVAAALVLVVTAGGTAWTMRDISRNGGCQTGGSPLSSAPCVDRGQP